MSNFIAWLAAVAVAGCGTDLVSDPSGDPMTAAIEQDLATCSHLPSHVTPRLVSEVTYLSEELAFDGAGSLVAKKGEFLLRVPPNGPTSYFSKDPVLATLSLGLRYLPDGDLAVTQPAVEDGLVARIVRVHADGTTADYVTAADMPPELPPFIIPNTIAPDDTGGLYVGDFATSQVFHVAPDRSVISIVVGDAAASVAGSAWDTTQHALYYTSTSTLRRVQIGSDGHAAGAPAIVADIPNARLDGVVLDRCGNAYAIDSSPATNHFALWRIGAGAPVQIASFDDIVSGAQFGAGAGWDDQSIYVSSVAGKIYRVKVGVRGLR